MATIPKVSNPAGRKGRPISAAPLTVNQHVSGVFQIKPSEVKRIVASKPGKDEKR